MEEENKVSIWAGTMKGAKRLNEYSSETYDDDGNMASGFMNDFEIEFYDSQFLETLFDASGNPEILKNFSYSQKLLPMLPIERFSGCNCFIFIYNFNYDGAISETSSFAFIGAFDYR